MPAALLENAGHGDPVKDIGGGVSVDESGNGIVRNDTEIMYTGFQHTGGNKKPNCAGNEIAYISLFFVLPAPADEEEDGDRDHQNDRDGQRRNAVFANGNILKRCHSPSPPQTSTEKPLWPHSGQVSLRAVGV